MAKDKPKISESEFQNLDNQFSEFEQEVKSLTMDKMNLVPKAEVEPQTKLSTSEIEKSKEIYLKPSRSIGSSQKFNEKFREPYNFDKQYVHFIAENNEIKGDMIEIWTRPYGGVPAEFWQVPVNKPVWGPRYLAEQIKRKFYHRLVSDEAKVTSNEGQMKYYGSIVVDTTVQRLDARPVSTRKSLFMGATSF